MSVFFFMLPLAAAVTLAAAAGDERYRLPTYVEGVALLLALLTLAAMRLLLPAESVAVWWPLASLTLMALAGLAAGQDSRERARLIPLILLFAAGGAATIAVAPAVVVTTWTLLALVIWLVRESDDEAGKQPGLLWAGALLVWLSVASLPVLAIAPGSSALSSPLADVEDFPALTQLFLLLAALVLLGAFPLHLWRPSLPWRDRTIGVLAQTAPVAAGALLLARLADEADVVSDYALPLTLAGLLGLLWAAYRAWQERENSWALAFSLLLAEASLLVLAGTWTDGAAVLAASRVLILGAGVLLVAAGRDTEGWQQVALLPVAAALASFPLTAGFTARNALYSAWLDSGRWLLVVVTVLLTAPMLAALLSWLWPRERPRGRPMSRVLWPLLPALGLISWQGFRDLSLPALLAIGLQIGAAFLLFRYREQTEEVRQLLAQAISPPWEVGPAVVVFRRGTAMVRSAVREAALMLEGEGALMWVLLFLVVLWLAR